MVGKVKKEDNKQEDQKIRLKWATKSKLPTGIKDWSQNFDTQRIA